MRNLVTAFLASLIGLGAFAGTAAAGDKGTIVDKVVELSGASGFDDEAGDFDILRDAVIATELAGPLSGTKQYTVFAPTDQAFLDLTGEATESEAFDTVAGLGTKKVRQILKYHVAEGRLGAKKVVQAKRIKTLYKREDIRKKRGSTTLKDATGRKVGIAVPNAAKVDNGVIHVLDGVLLPFELGR